MKRTLLITGLLLLGIVAGAQTRKPRGELMYYEVHDGDTMFFDTIEPTWCFPKGKGMKNIKLIYKSLKAVGIKLLPSLFFVYETFT